MNNSDLSLDFLKKCQKCRENGVPNDIAILAALQDLADYKDQHPREVFWDADKVIEWLREYTDDYIVRDTDDCWLREDDFIRDLKNYMQDESEN